MRGEYKTWAWMTLTKDGLLLEGQKIVTRGEEMKIISLRKKIQNIKKWMMEFAKWTKKNIREGKMMEIMIC